MHIVTLGEILIDMFPAEVGRPLTEVTAFRPKPGGAPANVAVAAHRLGAEHRLHRQSWRRHFWSPTDRCPAQTKASKREACASTTTARTTMAIIAMPDEHTAEFVFYRNPGADLHLRTDELDVELLQNTRALHIGSLSLVDEPSRSATFEAVRLPRQPVRSSPLTSIIGRVCGAALKTL